MRKKWLIILLSVFMGLLSCTLSFADNSQDDGSGSNGAIVGILLDIESALGAQGKIYFQLSALLTETKNLYNEIHQFIVWMEQSSIYQIKNYITAISAWNATQQAQTESADNLSKKLSDANVSNTSVADRVNDIYNAINQSGKSGLNAQTFLGTSTHTYDAGSSVKTSTSETYNNQQEQSAKAYLKILAGNGLSIDKPSSSKNPTLDQEKALNAYHTLVAIQSLNNYTLSHIYSKKQPVKINNMNTSFIEPDGSFSAETLAKYIQTQTFANPKWYAAMQKASPVTIARQMLFMLAANLAAQNQIEKNQRMMLANQAAANTLLLYLAKSAMSGVQEAQNAQTEAQQQAISQ